MNKWHIKHPNDERKTICGRLTARRVTDDIKRFKTRPCENCLKFLEEMKIGDKLNKKELRKIIAGGSSHIFEKKMYALAERALKK